MAFTILTGNGNSILTRLTIFAWRTDGDLAIDAVLAIFAIRACDADAVLAISTDDRNAILAVEADAGLAICTCEADRAIDTILAIGASFTKRNFIVEF